MSSSDQKAGKEIIPGYVLRKRIGAGGYGEVWLADAPGGLQKAIKLVFGTVQESHATAELKSLKRIKEVNHPFLLSLERIEVINNQVVIVTELAESSVMDRFQTYRRQGEPGIPRAILLDYLRDTADGLDFLAQKHSLQHLDVKPGNLLIIANRVKVADFGLVKDLQDCSQSLVSGLTPAYSAPEIFDGRPDYRSDQYSLAIVYMEMLTGHLPFKGKTTGELARQHLATQPDLEALPPADRPVVLRALSKNPLDRYSTCKQFVEQLQKVRASSIPHNPSSNESTSAGSTTDHTAEISSDSGQSSTDLTAKNQVDFKPRLEIENFTQAYSTPRSYFIGLGGMGCLSLKELRGMLIENCDGRLSVDDHGWLAIDTEPKVLKELVDKEDSHSLLNPRTVQIPIFKPIEYRDSDPELLQPISRRWLYNIPKSLQTEGVRPLATLALLDHYDALRKKLAMELKELVEEHERDTDTIEPMRIYLLASLHGGTGSGLLCEIGIMIRHIMAELNYSNYRICSHVLWATTLHNSLASMPCAAALATLSELSHLMDPDTVASNLYYKEDASHGSYPPFDWVSLVDGGLHGDKRDAEFAIGRLSTSVFVDSQSIQSKVLAEDRAEHRLQRLGWLRTVEVAPMRLNYDFDEDSLAKMCAIQAVFDSCDYLQGSKAHTKNAQENNAPTVSGDVPLTAQASEEFTKRLLRDLGVATQGHSFKQLRTGENGRAVLAAWARRLTANREIVDAQIQQDLKVWTTSIRKVVEIRMYNWKQIERIQLSVVEGILNYCDRETEALVAYFEQFSELLGSPEQLKASAVRYLKYFAERCLEYLDHFQKGGKQLQHKVENWATSLTAGSKMDRQAIEEQTRQLPSNIQALADRICAGITAAIHEEAQAIVGVDIDGANPGPAPSRRKAELTLSTLIKLSKDLTVRTAKEMQIDLEQFDGGSDKDSEGIAVEDVKLFSPAFARFGSEVCRFVVAPRDHQNLLWRMLKSTGLQKTTTFLPAPASFGTYVTCESVVASFSRVLASFCRPSAQTLQLAERLYTRVDVDWPEVDNLFEIGSEQQLFPQAKGNVETPDEATQNIVLPIETGTISPANDLPASNG